MRTTIVTLLIAVGALLGLAAPASASVTDTVGRPVGHVHYGADAPLEDEAGWDCRFQGNRVCGPTLQAHNELADDLAWCDRATARITAATAGFGGDADELFWDECATRAYEGGDRHSSYLKMHAFLAAWA